VQNQISALVGGVMYEGTWNASTNTPTITSSVGSKGDYYIVSTAGSTNINGITSWNIGDWIIFNGSTWDKVDNTDAVSSVNGYTGAVSLVTSDVPESGSLYFTNARAIGSTLTGYTSGSGVVAATDTILQAIQKLNGNVSGLVTGVSSVFGRTGAVIAASGDYNTSQVTENTNLYYTEARVSANTDVAANTAARHAAVTIGTANGLSLSTQALSLALASGSATGALSSTDWNTFNNKLSTATAASTYVPYTGATANVNLGTNSLTAGVGSFASSGGGDTFSINHSSGSGIALNITKGGNGEGLYINKTSGSGNAATIIGTLNATTLVKSGGTSSQFLKADGSVDSSTYLTTSAASSTYLPLAGGTLTGDLTISKASTPLFQLIDTTNSKSLLFGADDNNTFIRSSSSTPIILQVNGGDTALTLASNGAATFSSSVRSNSHFIVSDGSASVVLQGYINNALRIAESGSGSSGGSRGGLYVGAMDVGGTALFGGGGSSDVNNVAIRVPNTKFQTFYNAADTGWAFSLGTNSSNDGLLIANNNMTFSSGTSATERMRITSGGNVLIGTTSTALLGLATISYNTNDTPNPTLLVRNGGGNAAFISFSDSGDSTTLYGWILRSGSGVNYASASDYRLKENVIPIENALSRVSKLNPVSYDWKIDGSKDEGFIAHELQEVIPYAVNGEKDGEQMQGVDYSKIVPILVKAIQEQQAQIEELKAKILSL
jgi:hypothetical protein